MELHEHPANTPFSYGRHTYVRAPQPIHFPSEESPEEQVSETKRHLEARTMLYLLLKEAVATTAAIGSEQFVYFDAADPRRCLSPDAFVKLGVREGSFDTWKVWERGALDLAVEIVSDSDRSEEEWKVKLARYLASGTVEVVRFDPDDEEPIRVWDRIEGDLVERARPSHLVRECLSLGLWWVVVPSDYGPMLRLAQDRDGKALVPTPSEDRLRLGWELSEERRARALAEHERLLAEHAKKLAEKERDAVANERDAAMAEVERLRAELESLRSKAGDPAGTPLK